MVTCCVNGCRNGRIKPDGVQFVRFPKDERYQKWVDQVRKVKGSDWLPSPTTVICTQHFQPKQFYKGPRVKVKLLPGAVPCISASPPVSSATQATMDAAAGAGGDDNPGGGHPRLVVADVDTGIDDALALLLLLAADAAGELRLGAVTCVGGNTDLASVCRNTLRLLAAANRLDIPVFAGADRPLIGECSVKSTYHGADGFGDLAESTVPALPRPVEELLQKEHAVVALNRIVSENKGRVTLVCLAPLTNVALAARTYPAFAEGLRELHVMGGNAKGSGNFTPCAEFNFGMDPEAAHIVLSSVACAVQVTPWEPCAGHPIGSDWRFGELPGFGGGAALAMVTAAQRAIHKPPESDWVCCDELAVAALLRPALVVNAHLRHVAVELAGSRTRGQMVPACVNWSGACAEDCAGPPAAATAACSRRPARILDAFDMAAFKELLRWAAPRWTRPALRTASADLQKRVPICD